MAVVCFIQLAQIKFSIGPPCPLDLDIHFRCLQKKTVYHCPLWVAVRNTNPQRLISWSASVRPFLPSQIAKSTTVRGGKGLGTSNSSIDRRTSGVMVLPHFRFGNPFAVKPDGVSSLQQTQFCRRRVSAAFRCVHDALTVRIEDFILCLFILHFQQTPPHLQSIRIGNCISLSIAGSRYVRCCNRQLHRNGRMGSYR